MTGRGSRCTVHGLEVPRVVTVVECRRDRAGHVRGEWVWVAAGWRPGPTTLVLILAWSELRRRACRGVGRY